MDSCASLPAEAMPDTTAPNSLDVRSNTQRSRGQPHVAPLWPTTSVPSTVTVYSASQMIMTNGRKKVGRWDKSLLTRRGNTHLIGEFRWSLCPGGSELPRISAGYSL